jgi:type II secretory pathway component GspD/PulD (secretin)
MVLMSAFTRSAAWWIALTLMTAPCVLGSEPAQPLPESRSAQAPKAPAKKSAKPKRPAPRAGKDQQRKAGRNAVHDSDTLVLPLKHTPVERMAEHVQRLFGGSPRVRISADQPTNMLLVRAPAEVLAQVKHLVAVLEDAAADTARDADRRVRVFRLEHTDAERVREMILELSPFSFEGPRLSIECDPRTNSLLINAGREDWDTIETIIQAVDTRD